MLWKNLYGIENMPEMKDIEKYVGSPLWSELCLFAENECGARRYIEYSKCSMKKGWNVKYKRNGRALCTLYPGEKVFECMVSVGRKEASEAELILPGCSKYIKELYENTEGLNGAKWLMIEVAYEEILVDVKKLIKLRMKK